MKITKFLTIFFICCTLSTYAQVNEDIIKFGMTSNEVKNSLLNYRQYNDSYITHNKYTNLVLDYKNCEYENDKLYNIAFISKSFTSLSKQYEICNNIVIDLEKNGYNVIHSSNEEKLYIYENLDYKYKIDISGDILKINIYNKNFIAKNNIQNSPDKLQKYAIYTKESYKNLKYKEYINTGNNYLLAGVLTGIAAGGFYGYAVRNIKYENGENVKSQEYNFGMVAGTLMAVTSVITFINSIIYYNKAYVMFTPYYNYNTIGCTAKIKF